MIPLLRPSCTEAEIAAVADVLRSGWWGQGPVCEEFERQLAARYGYKHCVTTNSATAALTLALRAYDIGPGDWIMLPALTFVSTALAVTYCQATPIFADVDAQTLCVNWSVLRTMASTDVRVGIGVDFAGYPAEVRSHSWGGVPLLQDAAHSCGGISWGEMVCLSFHPVKNLATGDGGAVLLNDDDRAERLRRLRWCGITKSTFDRVGDRYRWDYDIPELGYKAHWNDIQAAIGLVQLQRLDAMNARRHEIALRYSVALDGLCQLPADHERHTWHLYVIRVSAERRDSLIAELARAGVSAGVHYKPLTYYPAFCRQPTPPVTEYEWRRCISLPIFADMTDSEQEHVIETVTTALQRRAA